MTEFEMQQLAVFHRIASALEAIALTNAPAPNFVKSIDTFSAFDFTSIGATVKSADQFGPTDLEWGGYAWTRRSPQNKFGEAIWFSRAIGKDAEGNVKYARLITFRKMGEAEPLPRKVEALTGQHTQPAASAPLPVEQKPVPSDLEQFFGPREPAASAQPVTPPAPAAPKPAGTNGNGKTKPQAAAIKTPNFQKMLATLSQKTPYYNDAKTGQANGFHATVSAAKCGYTEITDQNWPTLLNDLVQHAIDQTLESK